MVILSFDITENGRKSAYASHCPSKEPLENSYFISLQICVHKSKLSQIIPFTGPLITLNCIVPSPTTSAFIHRTPGCSFSNKDTQ